MFTNGSVTIEDGKKANEEYAPARKVSVTLGFAVPAEVTDSAQAKVYLDTAASVANAKVAELLGTTAPVAVPTTAAVKPTKVTGKKADAPAPAAETPKERTKADLEAEAIAAASKKPEAPLVEAEDDLSDVLGSQPAPAPITDKQMSEACIAKANKMKTVAGWEAKKIRTLIEEFTGAPGKKVQDIAADKRPDFMEKLEALK